LGYIYWHWCRGLTDGPTNHIIYDEKYANDYGEKWYTFHAFYSTTDYELRTFPGTEHGAAYVASRSDVCIDSYYWGRINVSRQTYTDYKKNYTYSRWTDYSAWQDAEITASDTKRVQTRTVYRYDLAALGHDFSVSTEKQFLAEPHLLRSDELGADCYAIGTVCSRCGAVAPDSTSYPHNVPDFAAEPEAYELITAATDPVQVYRTYCRGGCGCWYDVSVNTCEWSETVIAPTCTEEGYTLHTCSLHGETYKSDAVPALGHDMSGEWVITKNPTCTEAGEMERLCARYDVCGYKETQPISPLEHSMTAFEAFDPTCTEDGASEHYHCAVCDKYFADENGEAEIEENSWIVPALGHNDGEWRVIEEPGCGKTGYEGRYCTRENNGEVCDCLLEEREIPALTPDYYVSEAVNAIQNENGEWVAEGCGEYAYIIWTCRTCGDSYPEVLDPAEHTPGEWVVDEEASCVHAGHRHMDCAVCGTRLKDEIIDAPRTEHDYRIVETVESACTAGTPLNHYVCSICGETECEACSTSGVPHHYWDGDPKDHSIVLKNETAPTCTESGQRIFGCENCDYFYTETISPLNHDWAFAEHTDPTCTEQGFDLYRCRRDNCGAEEKRFTDGALGHDHSGEYRIVTEATCTEPGEEALFCIRENHGEACGTQLDKREIPAFGHDWGDWADNKDGTHARVCANDASHVETAAHKWDDGTVTKQPTATEEGEYTYHCLDCTAVSVYPIPILPDEEDHGVKTEKTAEYDADTGEATIRLKASADDEVIEAKTVGGAPLDIVLVIDQSGSMQGSRVAALNKAAAAFADMVQKDAQNKGVDHRMAVVGFAMGIYSQEGYPAYTNTEIRTVAGSPIGYSKNLKTDVYRKALVSVNKDGKIDPIVRSAVSSFKTYGATAADVGLSMANNIFANTPLTGNRERIVVFMTDGEPNHKTGFDDAVANAAIQQAYQLKHTYGATVYSIGVECGSDGNIVNFLNSVSSNYPDAVSMSAKGKASDNKYKISVTDATKQLSGVFKDIAVSSVAGKARFSDVTLTDTLSKYFTLTEQQEIMLRKNAISALGVTNADISVTRNTDETTEIVIRHIEPKTVGSSRVIEFSFKASANENTLQKGLYKTNTENAGITLGDSGMFEETFISPVVKLNESRNAAIFTVNGEVYHILSLKNGEPVAAPTYEVSSGYTFNGWNVPENTVIDGGSLTFDAELSGTTYTVTWNLPGETKTVSYYPGQIIAVPAADSGLVCDPSVPVVMPAKNLIFTLTAAEHEHSYDRYIVKSPTCTENGSAEYICTVCGDSYAEQLDALGGEHHWIAIVGATDAKFTGYEDFRCDTCGEYMGTRLQYKTESGFVNSYSGVATVKYEMSTTDINSGKTAQPTAPVEIVITPPTSILSARRINVYRKDDSGNTLLTSDCQNGILKFTTEHFCLFTFEAVFSCEEDGVEHPDKNRDRICDLCGFEIPVDPNESEFRCKMCSTYELMKDVPVIGFFYTIVHFFVHLAHFIGYLT
ncbi:MAG: VWA domain-containing protein, partial [Clostridia bacterium]|nr:VWA domain-containing protein [Clostridia bacterium]